jgi:hypothetical protein
MLFYLMKEDLGKEGEGMKRIDLTNMKFGRLTVIEYVGNRKWLCKCECGNEKVVEGSSLRAGITHSCGCFNSDRIAERNLKHGFCNKSIYTTYKGMKQRCYNMNCQAFKNYGGRGIKVCDEWLNDFKAFYDYVSKLPHFNEPGFTLDRINNDGDYEPGNVRWASRIEQNTNRRNCKNAIT